MSEYISGEEDLKLPLAQEDLDKWVEWQGEGQSEERKELLRAIAQRAKTKKQLYSASTPAAQWNKTRMYFSYGEREQCWSALAAFVAGECTAKEFREVLTQVRKRGEVKMKAESEERREEHRRERAERRQAEFQQKVAEVYAPIKDRLDAVVERLLSIFPNAPSLNVPTPAGRVIRITPTEIMYADSVMFGSWYGNLHLRVQDGTVTKLGRSIDIDDLEAAAADPVATGRALQQCCVCARELTDDESRRRGYGPDCAANLGLPYGRKIA